MPADEGIDLREILLARPGKDGSEVQVAADIDEIKALLANGASPAEAVLPHAEPANPQQLLLFE